MQITASQVKELREKTGSAMMACKQALQETNGSLEEAVKLLRKKGISAAEKRSGRTAKEGVITTYIHPGNKLGVLLELNCETDFVAKTDEFNELAKNICMQIAGASPQVIAENDLSEEVINKEKEIYMSQAQGQGKQEKFLDKIVEGKLKKYFDEVCLIRQAYIKDSDKTVKTLLDETIGKLGENIVIRRFARFRLGD